MGEGQRGSGDGTCVEICSIGSEPASPSGITGRGLGSTPMVDHTQGTPDERHERPGVGDDAATPRWRGLATEPGVSGSSQGPCGQYGWCRVGRSCQLKQGCGPCETSWGMRGDRSVTRSSRMPSPTNTMAPTITLPPSVGTLGNTIASAGVGPQTRGRIVGVTEGA